MPTDPGPPPPDWSSTEFTKAQNAATSYGYDSTNLAILDVNNNDNYLVVGIGQTAGHIQWYFRTAPNCSGCVYCQIPSATFTVIKSGTLNTSNWQIAYGGKNYQLVIERDGTTGNAIAVANQV